MSTVPTPMLPANAQTPFERDLVRALDKILRDHARAINEGATGKIAWTAASSTAPTQPGSKGDTVRNLNPTVQGSVGSQYIVDGWRYADDGTWHEISHLTDG